MASGGFTFDDDDDDGGPALVDDGTFFPVLPLFPYPVDEEPPVVHVGGLVAVEAVLARTDTVAVVVRNLVAHPAGFGFALVAHHRDRRDGHAMFASGSDPNESLRLGLVYPDGLRVLPDMFGRPHPGATHRLEPGGGSADGWSSETDYQAFPLPGPGELTFVVRWRAEGIEDVANALDTAPLIEAAGRARPLWD